MTANTTTEARTRSDQEIASMLTTAVPVVQATVQAEVDAVLADPPPHLVACGAVLASRGAWLALAARVVHAHDATRTRPRGGRPGNGAPAFRRLARELRAIADQADIAAEDAEDQGARYERALARAVTEDALPVVVT